MRNISVRRCQTVPTPAPQSSTRNPGGTGPPMSLSPMTPTGGSYSSSQHSLATESEARSNQEESHDDTEKDGEEEGRPNLSPN